MLIMNICAEGTAHDCEILHTFGMHIFLLTPRTEVRVYLKLKLFELNSLPLIYGLKAWYRSLKELQDRLK